jgi:endonuclease/exonuclease/phosphatase family metal-dependent hydrolase
MTSIPCHVITYNVHGLPWSRKYIHEIGTWLCSQQIPIICLQEVFTESGRAAYKNILERAGYEVIIPRDSNVSMMPSGLLIAILTTKYTILSNCFQSYLTYHNVEIVANKGFFVLWLQEKITRRKFYIVNTHTQSDTELTWFFGKKLMDLTRYKQGEQILQYFENTSDPVILVGDLNQETSIHPYIRYLQPNSALPLKKSTFFHTGEDLDHVAWLPLQYAKKGCGFCDIRNRGPQIARCKVHELPWSDHAAVEALVYIPPLPVE